MNPAAESSDRFPAFRMEPRSASWLNPYTMISYVPVWKLSARRYRGYHFPRWYVSSSGTSRRLEIIEVRRGIGHLIDYARCHWLGCARKRSCQKTRPQRREVWNQSDGTLSSAKKEGKIGEKRVSRCGMTRCEFTLWRRSYRRITTSDYLAGRLRFQIGIRIANAPIGKVLWTYCRRGMMEGDARGVAQRRSTVHDWSKCSFRNDARQQVPCFIYLILISESLPSERIGIERHGSLVAVHYRPITCVNPASNCLQLSLYVCNVVTASSRPLCYIYLQCRYP